ncbi:fimbrial protein [Serratia fonticola]|uniref:fimbrial protein n=1 Tax=Serratia fonticola TaxID=47917 RepID=UPI00192B6905|nr:hypothetical protein [Serratia fonticola]MBL5902945.1 hypothetical protein [Serratia fonticola]
MKYVLRSLFSKYNFIIIFMMVASGSVYATCTGTTVTSPFTPALVKINKNTSVGQVVSSATVTLTTTCNGSGASVGSTSWIFNYTPKSPLVSTSLGQGTFATGMSGLGYRMYDPSGKLVVPTSYGTNGGDNFGINGTGGTATVPFISTATFNFRIELVRTDVSLTSGTFSSSLMDFGYQNGGGYGNCPEGTTVAKCTTQFGSETTSPVVFQFVPPMCTVASDSQTLTVKLPPINASQMNVAVGTTAQDTAFNLNLIDCISQSGITMTMNGTISTLSSVLKNTGSATGVNVQILHSGSPITMNSPINVGNTNSDTAYTIPLTARYYQSTASTMPGSVSTTSTITLTYN